MKPCETSARKEEQQAPRGAPTPPASGRLGGRREKKAWKNQTIKIRVWVPELYSQLWRVIRMVLYIAQMNIHSSR